MSRLRYAAWLVWIAVKLILVFSLGKRGVLFVYQGF